MGNAPGTQATIEIVGVVRDTKYSNLRAESPPQMFVPFASRRGAVVYIRTASDPTVLFGSIRSILREIDATVPLYDFRTLEEQVDRSLVAERLIATLSSAF